MDPLRPPRSLQQMLFTKLLASYINGIPSGDMQLYFGERAYEMWRLKLTPDDYNNLKLIEWMCLDLQKSNEDDLASVISAIFEQLHDMRIISDQSLKDLRTLKPGDSIEKQFKTSFETYKTIYEADFRLWGTIPYLYVCEKILGGKKKLDAYVDYLEVGSSEKLETLRRIKLELIQGKIRSLVVGFDNKLRRASSAHDRWEITDDSTVLLKDVNPYTGKFREAKEMSLKDVKNAIEKVQARVLVLEIGLMIFLTNHPQITSKMTYKQELKIREIERHLRDHVGTLQMKVNHFKFDRKHLKIEVQKQLVVAGMEGEIFMGDRTHMDIAVARRTVRYEDQALGVLQVIYHLNNKEVFDADVKVLDENGTILMDAHYDNDGIAKFNNTDEKPKPAKGKVCDLEYELIMEYPVPTGMRKIFEKELKDYKHD